MTDLVIQQGSTFRYVFRWATTTVKYAAITAIAKTAPVAITAPAHGAPSGWPVAVQSVVGMKEINALHTPPRGNDYHAAVVPDINTVQLNDINALGYAEYTSGGVLVYYAPMDMAGYTANMQIRPSVASATIIATLTTANGGVLIDNTQKTVTILLTPAQTALLTFSQAVYSLEMTSPTGEVNQWQAGNVSLLLETTR